MIRSVEHITGFGVFTNFQWPSGLPDFKQFNLIYGWNYSGKTTLSRAFRCFEQKAPHADFSGAQVQVNSYDGTIHYLSSPNNAPVFRVFNNDFVRENLSFTDSSATPILVLGTEDIAKQEILKSKKAERETLSLEIEKNRKKKTGKEENANRLEIRNPGHSIKAEEQLGEPGSETRNPRIAAVLHEVNIAETKGSGIRAMRELMLAQDLLPPTFESSRRPDQFVATFLFHHFLGPDDLVWLRNLTSEPISDEESRALVFVRELEAIDNAAYRAINRTDTLNASGHLRRLRDLDLLEMKGAGSRTYYVPGPRFHAAQRVSVPEIVSGPSNSHQDAQNSHQPGGYSHQLLATIPAYLAERVPPAGSKPRRDIIRALIVDLCRWRALSARELASILHGREHKPLVRDYLTPMVGEGLLAYTIPAMENHPDQRYTVPASVAGSCDSTI